eukprot:g11066.t1
MRATELLEKYMTEPHEPQTLHDLLIFLKESNEEKARYEIRGEDSILEVRANRRVDPHTGKSCQPRSNGWKQGVRRKQLREMQGSPDTKYVIVRDEDGVDEESSATPGGTPASSNSVVGRSHTFVVKGEGNGKGHSAKGSLVVKGAAGPKGHNGKKGGAFVEPHHQTSYNYYSNVIYTYPVPGYGSYAQGGYNSYHRSAAAKKDSYKHKRIDERLFFAKYGMDEIAQEKLHELSDAKQQEAMRRFNPVKSVLRSERADTTAPATDDKDATWMAHYGGAGGRAAVAPYAAAPYTYGYVAAGYPAASGLQPVTTLIQYVDANGAPTVAGASTAPGTFVPVGAGAGTRCVYPQAAGGMPTLAVGGTAPTTTTTTTCAAPGGLLCGYIYAQTNPLTHQSSRLRPDHAVSKGNNVDKVPA